MRNAILAAIIAAFATGAVAGPPPKYLDVDVNFQQLQKLPTLNAQQGASMLLVVRPKLAGGWLSLTNMTATWQARATMTSTNYYGSASTDTGGYTSNAVHQIAIPLDDGDTGDALTNWTYSVALVFGGDSYPIGTGVYSVARTTFQGGGTLLNDTNIWATKTWVLGQIADTDVGALELRVEAVEALTNAINSAVQTVTPSTGINVTTSGTERVVGVTAAIAAGAAAGTTADQPGHTQPWASITNKPTTFPPVIGSGAGDAVAGNDARLTDARAPTAHTQPASTITNLLSVAQPLDADLTRLAGNDGSALVYPTNIYTVAADYTGTNTYYIIPGTINHIRMLATGSATLKIWMPGVAGSWRAYSRLEIYNPNLKPLIWASATGSVYWPSNGVYTGTARSVGKFGVASIYTGSTSHEVILVATNATELFYP
jgi:hypothetical protein